MGRTAWKSSKLFFQCLKPPSVSSQPNLACFNPYKNYSFLLFTQPA